MKKPNTTSLPAILSKDDIADTAAAHGKANSLSLKVADTVFQSRTLRYLHFAGALEGDGLYHGEHVFEVGDFKDEPTTNLNTLPNITGDPTDGI